MSGGRWKKRITKRRVLIAALWLGWALLLAVSVQNQSRLAAIYPAISLRYDTPISSTSATAAGRYAAANAGTSPFWPTFWTEQDNVETEGLHKTAARCIWFSGDAALVWPADFLQGGSPGPLDDAGCCISDTLAWRLWGNKDVTGYAVNIGEKNHTVRGVFREDDLLVLAGVGELPFEGGWRAVELSGAGDGDTRNAALAFAQASGLGEPATLIVGAAVSSLAGCFTVMPAVIMGVALLARLFRWLARLFPDRRWVIAFCCLLVFALALPSLLEMLPPSFIPTRFSNFAFWGRLIGEQWGYVKEWLLLRPYHTDASAKLLLAAQTAIWVLHSIISAVLIKLHYLHFRKIERGTK